MKIYKTILISMFIVNLLFARDNPFSVPSKFIKDYKESLKRELVVVNEFISLDMNSQEIIILTDDKLIDHIDIRSDNKMVFDFKREKTDFNTIKKKLNSSYFDSIVLGSHSGFYRLVIKFNIGTDNFRIRQDSYGIYIRY